MSRLPGPLDLLAREIVFRLVCRHRQGPRRNILLFCSRRGGSTWLLNTVSAQSGLRYVGQPFNQVQRSRWWRRMPDLAAAAEHRDPPHRFRQIVHFEGEAEERFQTLAADVLAPRIHVYPMLAFRAPYFQRVTNRVIFQMTNGPALIEWFDEHFDVDTVMLFRHPIPVGLSVMRAGWRHECLDFLYHRWFVETYLTGTQVDLARRTLANGSPLAAHVLDWSLKMLVPARAIASGQHSSWLALAYEPTITEPDRVVDLLAERLDLTDRDAMRRQIRRPSRTVTAETARQVDRPEYLLRRWRNRIRPAEERELLAIPHALGVNVYEPGRDEPTAAYLT